MARENPGFPWLLWSTVQGVVLIALVRAPFKVFVVIVLARHGNQHALGFVLGLQVAGVVGGPTRFRTIRAGTFTKRRVKQRLGLRTAWPDDKHLS